MFHESSTQVVWVGFAPSCSVGVGGARIIITIITPHPTYTVRGSIIFPDFATLSRFVAIFLLAGSDEEASEVPLQVIRTKDRISKPLASGYRWGEEGPFLVRHNFPYL